MIPLISMVWGAGVATLFWLHATGHDMADDRCLVFAIMAIVVGLVFSLWYWIHLEMK